MSELSPVIITGTSGFIGHHMARYVSMRTDQRVIGIDNRAPYYEVPGLWHNSADITSSIVKNVSTIFAQPKAHTIFHFAAVSRTVPAMNDARTCIKTNVYGTTQVLELARMMDQAAGRPGATRVVVASSNVVYAANTPYKASKLAMEEVCKAYHETYGVSVICLRFSNVYGREIQKGDGACLAMLRDEYLSSGRMHITGDGQQKRIFTHVKDIVRACDLAAQSDYCGHLDICNNLAVSMNYAAEALWDCRPAMVQSGRLWDAVPLYTESRAGDVMSIPQSGAEAWDILGFKPEFNFKVHIGDVWQF